MTKTTPVQERAEIYLPIEAMTPAAAQATLQPAVTAANLAAREAAAAVEAAQARVTELQQGATTVEAEVGDLVFRGLVSVVDGGARIAAARSAIAVAETVVAGAKRAETAARARAYAALAAKLRGDIAALTATCERQWAAVDDLRGKLAAADGECYWAAARNEPPALAGLHSQADGAEWQAARLAAEAAS